MKARSLTAALVVGAALSSMSLGMIGCARADEPASADETPIYSKQSDAAVNAAMAQARKTLPIFWAKFDAHAPNYGAFALKVALPADGGGVEHIWMDNLVRAGDQISGDLNNEPFDIKALHDRSKVMVRADQISDWQYGKDQKLYGHFSTRVMMDRATPEQRAQAEAIFAPTPLEAGNP